MSSTDTTKPNEIRTHVQRQIAAAKDLRIEAMARQGRVLLVEVTRRFAWR